MPKSVFAYKKHTDQIETENRAIETHLHETVIHFRVLLRK